MNGNASQSAKASPGAWRLPGYIPMTAALQAAIAAAYEIFEAYQHRFQANVCCCPVCVSEESRKQLLKTPLRQINGALLNEYSWSAHGVDSENEQANGPISDDLRYLLPRYFELIGNNDAAFDDMLENILGRLGQTPYRQYWPQVEVKAIDRFFEALLLACLANTNIGPLMQGCYPPARFCALQINDSLVMMLIAGGDLARLLDVWDKSPDPSAVLHMASLRQRVKFIDAQPLLHCVFLEGKEYVESAKAIGDFLMRPAVTRRIECAFFTTENPHEQQMLSDAL